MSATSNDTAVNGLSKFQHQNTTDVSKQASVLPSNVTIREYDILQSHLHLKALWKSLSSDIQSIDTTKETDFMTENAFNADTLQKTIESANNITLSKGAASVLARACELFLLDVTLRGKLGKVESSVTDNRELKKSDIIKGVADAEQYDCLTDGL